MRTRGQDNRFTSQDVCLVIDHTNERALLVGGRGEAENVVDMLSDNRLEVFTDKRGEKKHYKAILHGGNTQECGLGLPVLKYGTVVLWPNEARVDVRVCKPGVHKAPQEPVPPKAARYLALEAQQEQYVPEWFKWRKRSKPSKQKYRWVFDIEKEEWKEVPM